MSWLPSVPRLKTAEDSNAIQIKVWNGAEFASDPLKLWSTVFEIGGASSDIRLKAGAPGISYVPMTYAFVDEFDGTALSATRWATYNASGSGGTTTIARGTVAVGDGKVQISSANIVGAASITLMQPFYPKVDTRTYTADMESVYVYSPTGEQNIEMQVGLGPSAPLVGNAGNIKVSINRLVTGPYGNLMYFSLLGNGMSVPSTEFAVESPISSGSIRWEFSTNTTQWRIRALRLPALSVMHDFGWVSWPADLGTMDPMWFVLGDTETGQSTVTSAQWLRFEAA